MTDTVIFDMDGTLVDVTSVRHHLFERPRNFDAFHEGSRSCPPIAWVVDLAVQMHREGKEVIVVTGRSEKWRELSLEWLHKHLPIPIGGLFMRYGGDHRPGYMVKEEILARLLHGGREITFAADDDQRIVDMWTRNGIETVLVPGWEKANA